MACTSFMPSSISNVADEKHLSSISTPKPWRRTGSKPSMCIPTPPGSPKREPTDAGDCSSTDFGSSSGDDITSVYVDLADFSSSDSECCSSSPRNSGSAASTTLTTCVYSMMMLLRMRSSVCEDDDLDGVRYSAKSESELPARTTPTSRQSPKARKDSSDEVSWWRQAVEALPEASTSSWLVQQQQRNRNPAEDENVTRAARSILNKLSVEKFDKLFDQLTTTCGITHPHHISILMREVFEKATIQHHFIPMYAQLCVQLEKHPLIVSVIEESDEAGQLQNFRRVLLNECQSVFMQVLEVHEVDADEETAFRRKQRALGNMKLIGNLLVHGMLSSDLFVMCCEELLRKHKECSEALEALVALMMVAGPKFDKSTWQHYRKLETILLDMKMLTKEKSVSPRLRFLIRDVLEARDAGWPHSSGVKASEIGPSKLDEVKKNQAEAAKPQQNMPVQRTADRKNSDVVQTTSLKLAKAAPWKSKKMQSSEAGESKPAEVDAPKAVPEEGFQVVTFRKEVNAVFNDLASDRNIPAAVQRIRLQKVPVELQATQFVDILSRIVEERRGAVRRCGLAFIAGLGAAEHSAFDREQCLAGVGLFFKDVYADLSSEVHRLPAIMKSEFIPTMTNVFPVSDVNAVVPASMRK